MPHFWPGQRRSTLGTHHHASPPRPFPAHSVARMARTTASRFMIGGDSLSEATGELGGGDGPRGLSWSAGAPRGAGPWWGRALLGREPLGVWSGYCKTLKGGGDDRGIYEAGLRSDSTVLRSLHLRSWFPRSVALAGSSSLSIRSFSGICSYKRCSLGRL